MINDILLNPNFAYLFLTAGLTLAMFGLVTPGTGVLELGALFSLLLAGWGVYNLPVNYWALVVLLIGVIPFMLALRKTRNKIYLAISTFSLAVGSAFFFQGNTWYSLAINPALAIVTSILVGGLFWIAVSNILDAELATPSHDLGGLIGMIGEAKSDIHDEGSVQVHGELWTAQSDEFIPQFSVIRVVDRKGFVLKVEQVESPPEDINNNKEA